MAKVVFEFDDNEEAEDILMVAQRYKMAYALTKLSDFYREIYNGKLYTDELITVKDGKVLTEEDYKDYQANGEYPVKGTKEFISTDYIENLLDDVLNDVRNIID